MNLNTLTIQDCLDKQLQGYMAWIENGQLLGFVKEKSTEPDDQSDQC